MLRHRHRPSREAVARHRRLRRAGRIVTLAEGEISELHVGLEGTMNGLSAPLAERLGRL
jgi:hypothetical protein